MDMKHPPPNVVLLVYVIFAIVFVIILEFTLNIRFFGILIASIFVIMGSIQYYRIKKGKYLEIKGTFLERITKSLIALWIAAGIFFISAFGLYFSIDHIFGIENIDGMTVILLVVGLPLALWFIVLYIGLHWLGKM